jgi:hypothetical protein
MQGPLDCCEDDDPEAGHQGHCRHQAAFAGFCNSTKNRRKLCPIACGFCRRCRPLDAGALATGYVNRWHGPNITQADLERAELWLSARSSQGGARSMHSVLGGWRAKIINGTLFVRMLLQKSIWAEGASVLSMLLSIAPSLPNVDVVYVHSDMDPAPTSGWLPDGSCRRKACSSGQVPLLTNAFSGPRQGHMPRKRRWLKSSFPVPEFTWVGWGAHQPPWCKLRPLLHRAATQMPWTARVDAAFFAGSLENGRFRKRLAHLVAKAGPKGPFHLVATQSAFFHWSLNGTKRPQRSIGQVTGFVPIEEACKYRYALSIPGYGYSSRLRSLLACGCTVLHVRSSYQEYFQPLLENGSQLVILDAVHEILPALRNLQADESRARAIASGGFHFAHTALRYDAVLGYMHKLLREIAAREPEAPRLSPDKEYMRITDSRDLGKLLRLHQCAPGSSKGGRSARCCVGWNCPMQGRCSGWTWSGAQHGA